MRRVQAACEAERILIRLPNWLGDVVMSIPGLLALRAAAPSAHIVAHLPAPLAPLLDGLDVVDEVWPVEFQGRGRNISGAFSDIRRIHAARFDLGLVIPESISSALLMRLGRVGSVTGFARDPLRRVLLNRVTPADPTWGTRRLIAKERFVLALMASLGVISEDTTTRLVVTEGEKANLDQVLVDSDCEDLDWVNNAPVVIAPGASFGEAKCWPAECYAELSDRLVSDGIPVILLGAPGESERIAAVREAMEGEASVLDGVLEIGALKALLSGARALVANDAGARHVAIAFGVPSVIFFGPTSVEKTAENLSRVTVLESQHECRPCYLRDCPIDHRCLRSIDVDTAWDATTTALGGLNGQGAGPVIS
jgi:heptosyltransferase-2